jgi:hypothetical protein
MPELLHSPGLVGCERLICLVCLFLGSLIGELLVAALLPQHRSPVEGKLNGGSMSA